ncbi:alcohol oxidase [Testicularia cyperi]|uniref:Alcohol oxidase n=1 Tax=Testicularia cyperi TaxID=1882483 RepID=A0A317XRN2_9BASI|nr:alcohol oxidase [Testicularia cyperi]
MTIETPSTKTGVEVQDFTEFDYVVVGGGTAGLTVAARLSEDPKVTVGVIEAGLWRPEDPKINYPAFIGQTLMNPDYDWCLETEPQADSNGRKYIWPRGKVLGGSSALNFLVWQRGYKGEYDDIGKLGNKGWSWEDFASYCRKSCYTEMPSSELQKANLAVCDESVHGKNGPVQTSFSAWYTEAQKSWFDALKDLGLSNAIDGLNGDNSGFWASPATLCAKKKVRSYSASAYYAPNADRPNLKVLTGALARKVIFDDAAKSTNGDLVAKGVEFSVGGTVSSVKARKEVVLSCGTVHSASLLELSGIGRAEVLKAAGVEQKLELDVGENVQEHLYCTSSFKLKPGFITWDKMRQDDFAKAAMEQYHGDGEDRGIIASAFSGFAYVPLKQYLSAEEIAQIKDDVNKVDWSKYSKGVQEGVKMQLARMDDENCPFMEYIFAPGFFATASPPADGQEYYSILSALMQPFSRGTIHISSSDPTVAPKIDPKYFSVDADLQVLSKAVKYCNEMVSHDALKSITVGRQDPDPEKYSSEDDFREFTKDQSVTEYHPIGSCSMMPREKGGVVNERLKVHGTANLRVADASIIPLHVSSHIVSAVYAVGEKAADMIREDAAASA